MKLPDDGMSHFRLIAQRGEVEWQRKHQRLPFTNATDPWLSERQLAPGCLNVLHMVKCKYEIDKCYIYVQRPTCDSGRASPQAWD